MNSQLVKYSQIESKYDKAQLQEMIQKHYQYTLSPKAKMILDDFDKKVLEFKKIVPYDYQKMIDLIASYEKQGLSEDQAKIEAFYAARKG